MSEAPAILIVEDEPLVANFLGRVVRSIGYAVAGVCSNSSEALRALDQPDLRIVAAILDYSLRDGQTSLPVARELRRRSLPFMFLTGDDTAIAEEFGRTGYPVPILVKPVPLALLRETLRRTVGDSPA